MRYIDQWLSGLGLDHIIPLLQEHGITTPNKLAALSLRDMYEVVGVNDAEDRKKLHFLIQRLQNILKKTPETGESKGEDMQNDDPDAPESPTRATDDRDGPSAQGRKVYMSPVRHRSEIAPHTNDSPSVGSGGVKDADSSEDENEDLRVLRRQPRTTPQKSPLKEDGTTSSSRGHREHVVAVEEEENTDLIRVHSPIDVRSSLSTSNPSSPERMRAPSARSARERQASPNRDVPPLVSPAEKRRVEQRAPPVSISTTAASLMNEDSMDAEEESFRRMQLQQQHKLRQRGDVSYTSKSGSTTAQATTGYAQVPTHKATRSHKVPSQQQLSPPPSPPPTPPPLLEERGGGNRRPILSDRDRPRRFAGEEERTAKVDAALAGRSAVSARTPYNPVAYVRHPPAQASSVLETARTEIAGGPARSHSWQPAVDYADDADDMAIRVVVRKRPLSRSESNKGDKDVMDIRSVGQVLVHEPKTKVDLTKVVETQEFFFDDAFEETSSNEQIYGRVIWPLVRTAMQGGKASCFAYGQTGSGKTFTMMGSNPSNPSQVEENAGLYVLAARDMFRLLERANSPEDRNQKQVMVSCFEIYGGKLFDLLNQRGLVRCLEDAKQQVQLPGLTEHRVRDVEELLDMMSKAHEQRSTGSTGANLESSRSHQVLQLSLQVPKRSKRTAFQKIGQLTFIDLAGSERGADTTHNSKQTRMEGAEINTSLLALKEVIRSLEKKQGHTPFRGSKLTQVLKDSFVGENTRTCMVACVAPNMANCEHTLNTLRYADRVKEHQTSRTKDDSGIAMERPSTSGGQNLYDKAQRSASAQPMRPSTAQPAASGGSRGGSLLPRRGSDVGRNAGGASGSRGTVPSSSPSSYQASPMRAGARAASIGVGNTGREREWASKESSAKAKEAYPSSPARGARKQPTVEDEPAVKSSGFRLHRGGNNALSNLSAKSGGSSRQYLEAGDGRKLVSKLPSPDVSRRRQSEGSDTLMDSNGSSLSAPPPPPEGLPESNGELIMDFPQQRAPGRDSFGDDEYNSSEDVGNDQLNDSNDSSPLSPEEEEEEGGADGGLGGTALIQKTVELVSAHKTTISAMVEFMKEEMELVQHMEQSDPRDTHQYLDTLEDILASKSESIDALQETLQAFTSFRGGGRRKHIPQW